ncbi:MAG: MFS transporter [Pseudonocardiales bacterium]|nr:MFS transporter [Pseudonocardiales bacterium]
MATRAEQGVLSPALIAIGLGYFMVILDTTIVNVALPALRVDLRASVSGLQWVVDSYLLMLAALLLSGGALADRLGARQVFQLGLGVFVVASVGCGVAPTTVVLVITRVVQGVGAALAVPASLALLRAAYPDPGLRARAIGVWGGIAGIAAATGPILGGVLVTAASWRLVFFVNIPIGLAAMALTARHVPAPRGLPRSLDPAAQLAGVLALAALTLALIEGGHAGVTPLMIGGAVVFVAATAAFIAIERRVQHPMLPLRLFRDATFTGGNVVGLLINLGFYGELFVINLYFQQVLGYSALVAGLALLPQMGVVAAASALSGWYTARAGGPRPTMLIGLVTGGAGLLGLIVVGAHTPYLLLVGPLVAAGFGMAFTMPAATTAVVEAAPADRAGLASGSINAARQVGGVIGVALLGALLAGDGPIVPGLRIGLAIAGAAFLLGAAVTMITICPRHS